MSASIYIRKKVCWFFMHLDPVGASATIASCFVQGKVRGLLFDPKFSPPGYLVTTLSERYIKYPIQTVRACDCFLKRDEDPRFSPFDIRDSEGIKVCSSFNIQDR